MVGAEDLRCARSPSPQHRGVPARADCSLLAAGCVGEREEACSQGGLLCLPPPGTQRRSPLGTPRRTRPRLSRFWCVSSLGGTFGVCELGPDWDGGLRLDAMQGACHFLIGSWTCPVWDRRGFEGAHLTSPTAATGCVLQLSARGLQQWTADFGRAQTGGEKKRGETPVMTLLHLEWVVRVRSPACPWQNLCLACGRGLA